MKAAWLTWACIWGLILVKSLQAERPAFDPATQQASLLFDEAQTVYLGNLARRDQGLPPLRWNQQLTRAGRWFSYDSVENRASPYCGHQDTRGFWPDYRAREYGYLGSAGAENAFCGYVTPPAAIQGWLNSPGHRDNLLAEGHREIGLGYYRRGGSGPGYVAQMFGADTAFPPVIINHEAIQTVSAEVDLYIYDRLPADGFAALGPATEMMISSSECFQNAVWEPFAHQKSWTLPNEEGWQTVYVKTRDVFDRTTTVSDVIYLGANPPLGELGDAQMSTTQSAVMLTNLDGGPFSQVQLSLGWLADDASGAFRHWWGNGQAINDSEAWGGTAYRLSPGDGESFAWLIDTAFLKETPLVAYFRMRTSDNSSSSPMARISVKGGGTEYGPLLIKGTNFAQANAYQEFALPFTFHDNPNDVFLIFQVWRSGSAHIDFDAVSIFTTPQAIASPLSWTIPGGNYRGQGVWVRYTDGTQFSSIKEGMTAEPALSAAPRQMIFLADAGGARPLARRLQVEQRCGLSDWGVSDDAGWLTTEMAGEGVMVRANPAGLPAGTYTGHITLAADGMTPAITTVTLVVVERLAAVYLPLLQR